MSEAAGLVLAAVAGAALGAVFFGGLWWTVRRAVASPNPALWFFGSLLLRTSVALAGMYFVGAGQWERWAACLCGFVAARSIVTRLTLRAGDGPAPAREAVDAP